jgi:hypothetical protein
LGHRDVLWWGEVLVPAIILGHLLNKWRVWSKKLIHKITISCKWVSGPLLRLNLCLFASLHVYRASILIAVNVCVMDILPHTWYSRRCVSLCLQSLYKTWSLCFIFLLFFNLIRIIDRL